jgi:hypothetical protein
MLGIRSRLRPGLGALLLVAAFGFGACARNVVQDSASGKDAKVKGAKKIKIENDEGRARDIVTYPGGDRVDWKLVELPEGKKGTLDVQVRWQAPRPGLDLAFEVYDQYFQRVGRAKPSPGSGKRSKRAKVNGAEGKMYLMVYAPERGDAAKYTVTVRFKERKQGAVMDASAIDKEILDPPVLPAIPEGDATAVAGAAGGAGAPAGAGVGGAGAPAGAGGMPPGGGGAPMDPTMGQGGQGGGGMGGGGMGGGGQGGGGATAPAGPINGTIVAQQIQGDFVIITINRGKSSGVGQGWKGQILQSGTKKPLVNGSFTVIKVTERQSISKVKLSLDAINANRDVTLSP